jgi:methionine biosynthesis protein MetW
MMVQVTQIEAKEHDHERDPSTPIRPDFLRIGNIIPEGSTVLDLGCNDGDLLDYLIHEKRVDGQGVELSPDGVNACIDKGVNVIQGDITETLARLPSRNPFYYVILSQTLHELQKPDEVILDALAIGKNVIVSFYNLAYFKYRLNLLFKGTFPKDFPYSWKNTYASILTLEDFRHYCVKFGIDIVDQIFLDVRGKQIKNWLANWRAQTVVLILRKKDEISSQIE